MSAKPFILAAIETVLWGTHEHDRLRVRIGQQAKDHAQDQGEDEASEKGGKTSRGTTTEDVRSHP